LMPIVTALTFLLRCPYCNALRFNLVNLFAGKHASFDQRLDRRLDDIATAICDQRFDGRLHGDSDTGEGSGVMFLRVCRLCRRPVRRRCRVRRANGGLGGHSLE
jgi:hypothetical protein